MPADEAVNATGRSADDHEHADFGNAHSIAELPGPVGKLREQLSYTTSTFGSAGAEGSAAASRAARP